MNRLEEVTKLVFSSLEQKCFGVKKQTAYQHLFGVSTLCISLANTYHLDTQIAGILGILHDYATYYTGTSFDHAKRSALLAKDILITTTLFSDEEIHIITTAIANHSQKDTVDDSYSELLKNGDTMYYYLYEPTAVLSPNKQKRIDILKKQELLS